MEEFQLADDGVQEPADPARLLADILTLPQTPEVLAGSGQLVHQLGQSRMIQVGSRRRP